MPRGVLLLEMPVLIITGEEDKVCPPQLGMKIKAVMKDVTCENLEDVAHWHIYEDAAGVAAAVIKFLLRQRQF